MYIVRKQEVIYIIAYENIVTVRILVEHGADVTLRDKYGNTAAMIAACKKIDSVYTDDIDIDEILSLLNQ